MAFFEKMWFYLKGYRAVMALSVIFAIARTAVNLLPALLIRRVIVLVTGQSSSTSSSLGWFDTWSLTGIVLALLVIYGIRSTSYFYDRFLAHVASYGVLHQVRMTVYEKLQQLSHAYYNDKRTGDIASRAINDVETLEFFYAHGLPEGLVAVMVPLAMTAVLAFINWRLTLVMLIPVPVIVAIAFFYYPKMRRGWRAMRRQLGDVNAAVTDSIQGISVIKAFTYEKVKQKEIESQSARIRDDIIQGQKMTMIPNAMVDFLSGTGMLLILLVGGPWAVNGQISFADLFVFIFYLGQFYQPLLQISRTNENVQNAIAASERIFELLDTDPEVQDPSRPLDPAASKMNWDVTFDHVYFRYNQDEQALKDINLHIEEGKVLALVGPTGAGKTTITRLIPRFWDVESGQVLVGDVPVTDLSLHYLRSHIGMVLQDVFLFNDTVANNILVGRVDASREEVIEAAKAANAHEFISHLPKGYDTVVGERGVRLSGGQKQRLSIARAVLKDAPILIMDEATSSVDPETEHLIQQALNRLAVNRTTIVVAHRLSTIRSADEIVVIEEGEVRERGTHEWLMENGELYRRLNRNQLMARDWSIAKEDRLERSGD